MLGSRRQLGFALACARTLGSESNRFVSADANLAGLIANLREPKRQAVVARALDHMCDDLRSIHPTWYTPAETSTHPAALRYLQRLAYGHLTPMHSETSSPFDQLDSDQLLSLIAALGRRRVAIAFSGAPRTLLAQLLVRLGEPHAQELTDEIQSLSGKLKPAEVKLAQRGIERVLGRQQQPTHFFLEQGCAWLAPALLRRPHDSDQVLRLAQKIPRRLGEQLLASAELETSDADCDAVMQTALRLRSA